MVISSQIVVTERGVDDPRVEGRPPLPWVYLIWTGGVLECCSLASGLFNLVMISTGLSDVVILTVLKSILGDQKLVAPFN